MAVSERIGVKCRGLLDRAPCPECSAPAQTPGQRWAHGTHFPASSMPEPPLPCFSIKKQPEAGRPGAGRGACSASGPGWLPPPQPWPPCALHAAWAAALAYKSNQSLETFDPNQMARRTAPGRVSAASNSAGPPARGWEPLQAAALSITTLGFPGAGAAGGHDLSKMFRGIRITESSSSP